MTFDSNSSNKKRQRNDKLSRYVVTGFGGLVLLTLVILITHLISQALPLTYIPSLKHLNTFTTSESEALVSAGDIVNGQPLLVRKSDCRLGLKLLQDNTLVSNHEYIRPCEHVLSADSVMGENYIVDISPNALVRVLPVRSFDVSDNNPADMAAPPQTAQSVLINNITFSLPKKVWKERENWDMALSSKWAVVSITHGDSVFVRWVNRKRPTHIVDKRFYNIDRLTLLPGRESVLLQVDQTLYLNRLRDEGVALLPVVGNVSASLDEKIVFPLAKDRTFFLMNSKTETLTRWVLSKTDKGLSFEQTYQIPLSNEKVKDVAEHASMNLVAVLTSNARVLLVNRVSGDVVSSQKIDDSAEQIIWYGNKLYGFSDSTLSVWEGQHLSGITTWSSLFDPQHYEGYETEETVWQTTSASDFQEAKFSLTPLLIGSIKASLLALLIAIPVAIGAAIYTAFFAKSRMRNIVKPAIELLEAIPSVLIGFIAAIWLSPKAEQFLFSFAFFLIVIPFVLIAVAVVQRPVAEYLPKHLRHGAELIFAIGGVFLLGFISVEFAPSIVFSLMGVEGFTLLAAESDSPIGKTTIVVALALGVAISPSIYSLAEDAINGVPTDLKHASFALGATRLQTLLHIVLHVALPGIVAAIMLGFGRAFGETMIVLMVTGNTPISSWGLIEGLRALTANLAIELPEADVSSAHYQILFFTACILFLFTFLVNTVAELIRQRIRGRAYYG
ncbi:ABC transporter permease subunit [Alteromonas mediterranea]|uniref:Phosphate ABC transporter permease n=1 Tax=Alteromonas mediterranea TaxID=314275 RepID=A0AAC8XI58_9ALTE|nr:ABC transporter permease subunit [Alteromonas mediterranea]AFV84351.1 putative phosphate ABC transporter permease [Alteromonas mediterranea DE1]AGP96359.1 phosphate ABC transporter permease [Alteromonas mediterranea UM7]AGQ00693.1 phosphate ABC transporter permease [Alteromonas mediterranea UM4b]AMJ77536.1 phosphate ABC transporter permease [Alteromonas mediterranea]AMJ81689.1 phosphate ABC transporter permease [Alteromonas mediterranea]